MLRHVLELRLDSADVVQQSVTERDGPSGPLGEFASGSRLQRVPLVHDLAHHFRPAGEREQEDDSEETCKETIVSSGINRFRKIEVMKSFVSAREAQSRRALGLDGQREEVVAGADAALATDRLLSSLLVRVRAVVGRSCGTRVCRARVAVGKSACAGGGGPQSEAPRAHVGQEALERRERDARRRAVRAAVAHWPQAHALVRQVQLADQRQPPPRLGYTHCWLVKPEI